MTIQYLIGNPAQLPNRSDTPFSLVPLDDSTARSPIEKLALPPSHNNGLEGDVMGSRPPPPPSHRSVAY